MPRTPHPDDVMLSLGHVTTPDGPRISLYAEVAADSNSRRLMSLDLSSEEFALLLAARVITVRSASPLFPPLPPVHPPVQWMNVTLHATTNRYLQLPCAGQLQVTEYGTDGSIIHAIFRRRGADGELSAAVEVGQPVFTYADRRTVTA